MRFSTLEVSDGHANGGGDPDETDQRVKRKSNMYFAAAYNITAIIGVGVLGLPQAMVFLEWGGGLVVLFGTFFFTYFTMTHLVKLHEFEIVNMNKRHDTYHSLGIRALGRKWSRLVIVPLQMVVEVSLDILFTVAAGEAMNRIHDINHCHEPIHIFVWFVTFAAIQIVLSVVVQNFQSIRWIVVMAAIMSICYTTIAWTTILAVGNNEKVHYRLPMYLTVDNDAPAQELSDPDLALRVFNSIGVIAFAYAAHNVVLEIQNAIPSTPEKTSETEMMRAVWITYVVVALCYFPVAIVVYTKHGNKISQNVLSFLQYHVKAPSGVVVTANVMLILHLIGSYQVFAQPVFKLLEDRRQLGRHDYFKKFVIRFIYIGFSTVIAMIFPHFSPLLGFFGGFAIAPTTYILPCIIWLKINNPQRRWRSLDWYLNSAFIILGFLLMLVASVGGLSILIKESKDSRLLWTPHWRQSVFYNCPPQM
ncbi:hypothetical protein KC19_11G125500 [Ceratodon purpureus]|uniref:Amino acid transporter transmembrane domain-containing protein n=1 Tax=Ceratodon purpureus TaxID=3225 RepID=A0A8T0GFE7_CERPU|nr:hypothetical protein KC19_11G125500 [Ceratodon purpureus]